MGAAIAESAYLRGADVLLLRAKTSVKPRLDIKEKLFETADDLEKLLLKEIRDYDICIHTAAVSDFSIKNIKGKLSSDEKHTVILEPRQKILDQIKRVNPKIFLVAFKAEVGLSDKQLLEKARKIQANMIVANHVGRSDRGFESDNNEVFILGKTIRHVLLSPKSVVSEIILDEIVRAC
ncbi:MAG: hypothetical protein ACD_48C00681G0003 [uncultured bacterium]|nr:MAG: hypothetical protein ACD_48C00681G0003 [uncultured bacterium]